MLTCQNGLDLEVPCPDCGGKTHFWKIPASLECKRESSGIFCKTCHRTFSQTQWDVVLGSYLDKFQPTPG